MNDAPPQADRAVPRQRQKHVIAALQIARGLAALAVVFFHARIATDAFVDAIPAPVEKLLALGYLGVDFFFVLSGFIILHTHFDDARSLASVRAYAFKRLTRIYLPYFPVTLALVAGYALLPALSQGNRDWGWFTTLTLLPSDREPALVVAWSLVYEMMFYIVFLLYFLSRKAFAAAVAAWSAILLVQIAAPIPVSAPPLAVLLNPLCAEFIFGMVCALLYRRMSPQFGRLAIVVGLVLTASYFVLLSGYDQARVIFALGAALLVLGLSLNDVEPRNLAMRALVRLGDASYALYLIHVPLIAIAARLVAKLPLANNWLLGVLILVVCSVIGGYLYHRWIERPAFRFARGFAPPVQAPILPARQDRVR